MNCGHVEHQTNEDLGGIYPVAHEGHQLCFQTPFNYNFDEPTAPETAVPLNVCSSALATILGWICAPENVNLAAARAHTLATWLNPVHARFKSLNQIATACAVSRAGLSKALLQLKDEYSIGLTIGRLESSRAIYAEAQRAAIANGTHSSLRSTKKGGQSAQPNPKNMNQSVKTRYPTLDQATDRVAELEKQLGASRTSQQPQNTGTATAAKPAGAPRLEDLTTRELTEVMDVAHRSANQGLLSQAYAEVRRRRG